MSMRQLKITKSITNRESQSLDKYLHEIGKVELVSSEEEVVLAKKIRHGDQSALDKLTKANLRFVVSVAKQYQNQGLTLSDLINEGNLGLIKAARRFDETRGFKFISYAVWWIRQSILQAISEQSRIVRLPMNRVGLNSRVLKVYQELEQDFEREPTEEEVAEVLNIKPEEVAEVLGTNARHISMDSPVSEGAETTLLESLPNPNASNADEALEHIESLKQDLEWTMQTLTLRQKEILCHFYGIGMENPLSLEDIGIRLNLTRERVRQIKDIAVKKLRTSSRSKQLKLYMGQ